MQVVRWGIIGCGEVTEVKSGPGFQRASGSALVAVMRRDRAKAEDYARRHDVPRVHGTAHDLIHDSGIDAVYIATHPESHRALSLAVAEAGKPCLVEKPMAINYGECQDMVAAFARRSVPLWVAYYRRALPRFLKVRELLHAGLIGRVTSVEIEVLGRLPDGPGPSTPWRVDPAVGGAGHFFDVGSHNLDLVDFLIGPIVEIAGIAANTGGAYTAEDVTTAAFRLEGDVLGSGLWNFNTDRQSDRMIVRGSSGTITTAVFADADVAVASGGTTDILPIRNPPHVHQPLIQEIVDELGGRGRCSATGAVAARASWALDQCVRRFYANDRSPASTGGEP